MKILFLDGLGSNPSGFKPTFLRERGFEVIYPVLPDRDFEESVRIAQQARREHGPAVIVGYSRGGAVAMALEVQTPLVLIAPAWRLLGVPPRVGRRTVILHSSGDDLVPLEDSRELVQATGLPESALVVVGEDHSMIDGAALQALVEAVRVTTQP
jgi:pimeloyl-ACP methyl ester carboxylesterase